MVLKATAAIGGPPRIPMQLWSAAEQRSNQRFDRAPVCRDLDTNRLRRFLQISVAKAHQRTLTQKIGITLTLFRKFDNPLSDDFVDLVGSVEKPEGTACHLERHAHDARGLAIESDAIQECGDRHGSASLVPGGSAAHPLGLYA